MKERENDDSVAKLPHRQSENEMSWDGKHRIYPIKPESPIPL